MQAYGNQAALITRIIAIRETEGKLSEARRMPRWRSLVRSTRSLLLQQPLWRLRRVGNELLECFYPNPLVDGAIGWFGGLATAARSKLAG